jgi:streptogramin lyase
MARVLCCLLGLWTGCTDRPARNPLDPQAADPAVEVGPLEAVAGDGEVSLRWNYRAFEDLSGYRLYRRTEDGTLALYRELDAGTSAYSDLQVENGATYAYQLALLIQGEGERRLDPLRLATPGVQAAWAADLGSGVVWRVSPDNRAAFFGQGRFPGLVALGVDHRDGSCWVSDQYFKGLIRLSPQGELSEHPAAVGEPGALSIDPEAGVGWLVDRAQQTVSRFALPAGADSLELEVVDARFEGLAVLAAWEEGCWIGASHRVLHYWREGRSRQEWAVDQPTALAPTAEGGAWALVRGGRGLVYLEPAGGLSEVALPLDQGLAVEADLQSGGCWVAGPEGVVAMDAAGVERARWEGLGECRSLALDRRRQQMWIATPGQLLKVGASGQVLARLGGFASLHGVAVDPGNPR